MPTTNGLVAMAVRDGPIMARYATVVLAIIAVHAVLPQGLARDLLYAGPAAAAAVACGYGIVVHRPSHLTTWRLMQAAMILTVLGSVVWGALAALGHGTGAAQLFYLGAYLSAVGGAWALARRRAPADEVGTALDTAIVTTGAAVLMWVFVAHPLWDAAAVDGFARVMLAAYPMLGLVLLAVVVRLAFSSGERSPAFGLLIAGLGAVLVSDVLNAALVLNGHADIAIHAESVRLLGFGLLGAATLHPSIARLTEPAERITPRLSRARLAALWVASVAAPVTVVVRLGADAGAEVLVAAMGSVVLFTLVVARMWGLLRMLAETVRREHEDRYRALVENSEDVVFILDADQELTYLSPTIERVWGLTAHDLESERDGLMHPDDQSALLRALEEAETLPMGGSLRFSGRIRNAEGRWRRVDSTMANYLDHPAIRGVVHTLRDVTEQWQLEEQLSHQTFHDPLTGLPNRALLVDRTRQTLAANRDEETFAAMLLLDLDDFKTVNDVLGHEEGDAMLVVLARRLANVVRPEDTVARIGGDEFAVLVPRVASLDTVTTMADRILRTLREPVQLGAQHLDPQASLGIATSGPGVSADSLLRDADAAMYSAKRVDTGSFQVFDPAMHEAAVRRLQLKMDLSTAVENGQLTTVYQPIHDIASGQMRGVEALARWAHPVRGPVPPPEFIALAEESGIIDQLGEFVLRRACEDIMTYRARTGDDLFVTVNVSVVQLQDVDFPERVRDALADSGLPASRLTLELTESVFLEESEQIQATFTVLDQMGVKIAIDDFGTGFCSLNYLTRFRFDVIKIDKSFIDMLADPNADARVTLGILELVDSLGAPAVAEGIETAAQLGVLRDIGCPYGQGYHFSRPFPLDELPLPGRRLDSFSDLATDHELAPGSGLGLSGAGTTRSGINGPVN